MIKIIECPTCGSKRIRKVRKDVHGLLAGKYPYTAKNIEFYECPKCGEQLFDPQAMRQIESFRPKLRGKTPQRKAS